MQCIVQFINFLDEHSGSLTFLITVVYVIATIFICAANIRAANATREQVKESKRQFDETRRLEIMPYLQFESYDGSIDKALELMLVSGDEDGGRYITKFAIKNVGLGAANNIKWIWNWFNGNHERGDFPFKSFQSGETQYLKIEFALPHGQYDNTNASIMLQFEDLLGNCYSQMIELRFEYKQTGLRLSGHTSNPPVKIEQKGATQNA